MSLAGFWKQLQWSLDCMRMDQQWQKPVGHMCWVGDVVRAVDFDQRKGDVSSWTVGHNERRGTEVPGHSGIDGLWPPAWTSHDLMMMMAEIVLAKEYWNQCVLVIFRARCCSQWLLGSRCCSHSKGVSKANVGTTFCRPHGQWWCLNISRFTSSRQPLTVSLLPSHFCIYATCLH